jgi:hypothetical protein
MRGLLMIDLGTIHVDGLIVHEVPRHFVHSETSQGPTLSEVESILDPTVGLFFRERISKTLASTAFEVELDPDAGSPVPTLIAALLADQPDDFVDTSQKMAGHLHESQDGVSPAGLLTVIRCTLGDRRAIGIMKLEKEEGTRVRRTTQDGHKTFSVSHIADLMLTGKTRVFKVGLFTRVDGESVIEGLVCDKQKRLNTTVAYFSFNGSLAAS